MSTRKSTRTSSRLAGSRGTSPAVSVADIPATPARRATRLAGNAPMPAIGIRTSTAYGTNSIASPARSGPAVADQVTNILGELLGVHEETASTAGESRANRSRRQGGPSRNRNGARLSPVPSQQTFGDDSGAQRDADFDSSFRDTSSPAAPAQSDEDDEDVSILDTPDPAPAANRAQLEQLARNRLEEEQPAGPPGFLAKLKAAQESVIAFFKTAAKNVASIPLRLIFSGIAFLLLAFIFSGGPYRFYGWKDPRHNLGQFMPSNPLRRLLPSDVQTINQRLTNLEYQVAAVNRHSANSDAALRHIESLLPDHLVVKRDRDGKITIPDDFWSALLSKMKADPVLSLNWGDPNAKPIITRAIQDTVGKIHRDLNQYGEKYMTAALNKRWDDYVKTNKIKGSLIVQDETDKNLASKEEVITLIHQEFTKNSEEIFSELKGLNQKIKQDSRAIAELQKKQYSEQELNRLVEKYVDNLVPYSLTKIMAEKNIKSSVEVAKARINHFAPGTGGLVLPHFTSDTYLFPSHNAGIMRRMVQSAISNPIPSPNPPKAALEKWDEHGDCWCGITTEEPGKELRLGVMIENEINPDQIIIEHIPKTASLRPGAAPRDMDLLAFIPDPEDYKKAVKLSDEIFDDMTGNQEDPNIPDSFVRIATWSFDAKDEANNIQSFKPQIDLGQLDLFTNKFIIRARNNWGDGSVPFTCLYRVKVFGDMKNGPPVF